MSRARAVLLAIAGLALPVGLALAVYVASASSLAALPDVVLVDAPDKIARAATTTDPGVQTTTPSASNDDLPGKCRKPENQLDPDCDPRSAHEDDSSGSGSGSGEGDGSSGHGSGSGGGDDDSSGHGSGDDD